MNGGQSAVEGLGAVLTGPGARPLAPCALTARHPPPAAAPHTPKPRAPSPSPDLALLRNLLTDHFRAPEPIPAVPAKLPAERVLVFTARADGVVSMRHYAVAVGTVTANTIAMSAAAAAREVGADGERGVGAGARHVNLREIGPRCDLKLSRTRFADDDVRKSALKRPKSSASVPSRVKNVSHDELLGKRGRLRIERQDLHQAALKKVKALKKEKAPPKPAASAP